ncbi:MAG: TrkH family potassium uptake protein [Streptosporangiales bacterium]|nr:TrkH family potassium uptake protein [Streptosporangiales bacterium]
MVTALFAGTSILATGLLKLPIATASGESTTWLEALFTATSAVCINGLVVLDTGTHWSVFGQVVIAIGIQIGGLGIMTLATVLALAVSGRLGLLGRLVLREESKTLSMTDVRRVARDVVVFSLVCELIVAVVLTVRLMAGYGEPFGRSVYSGVFHAISAFNNAGFALWPDSMMRFSGDPWVTITVALAVIVGGLGFPVIFELLRSWRRPARWSVLTRLTLWVTAALLVIGTVVLLIAERANPHTLGPMETPDKLLAAFFAAVMPRTAGFNMIDISAMRSESWMFMDILMFIGGGSAGTSGGIKVTTFGLLAFVLWAELRGDAQVKLGRRAIPPLVQRQAIAIALFSAGVVAVSTFLVLSMTHFTLDRVLFEVVSAFGTTGLSTGITAQLPPAAHVLVVVLMFVGRVGPLTVGSALALRERTRHYKLPEERPIVG